MWFDLSLREKDFRRFFYIYIIYSIHIQPLASPIFRTLFFILGHIFLCKPGGILGHILSIIFRTCLRITILGHYFYLRRGTSASVIFFGAGSEHIIHFSIGSGGQYISYS